jgi:hypothetical protein
MEIRWCRGWRASHIPGSAELVKVIEFIEYSPGRTTISYHTILKKKIKLCGLSPQANYTERPPLVGEVSANFCGNCTH